MALLQSANWVCPKNKVHVFNSGIILIPERYNIFYVGCDPTKNSSERENLPVIKMKVCNYKICCADEEHYCKEIPEDTWSKPVCDATMMK